MKRRPCDDAFLESTARVHDAHTYGDAYWCPGWSEEQAEESANRPVRRFPTLGIVSPHLFYPYAD